MEYIYKYYEHNYKSICLSSYTSRQMCLLKPNVSATLRWSSLVVMNNTPTYR